MATPLQCGSCGAPLPIEGDAPRARCPYCGATSQLPGAAPRPPPRLTEPAEPLRPAPPRPPTPAELAAGRRTGAGVAVVAIGVPVGIVALVGGSLVLSAGPGQFFWEHMQWAGTTSPLLVDVDGDGTVEVLGLVRFFDGDDTVGAVAAFDAASGARRWVTRFEDTESFELRLAATPGRGWVADGRGRLWGLDLATGAVATHVSLGERPQRLCGDGAGGLRVWLEDRRALAVALTTGTTTPVGEVGWDTPCLGGLWTSAPGATPTTRFTDHLVGDEDTSPDPRVDVEARLRDEAGGVDYLLGHRTPGTAVPVVLARDPNGAVRWSVDVPTGDPLLAEEGAPDAVGLYGDRLLVSWALRDGETPGRVACLDARTGSRRWDAVLPDSDTGDVAAIVSDGERVFVSTWTWLHVLDAETGAHLHTIGRW